MLFSICYMEQKSHIVNFVKHQRYLSMCVCVYLHVYMATYTCDSVCMYEHVYVYNRGGESYKIVREQNLNIDSIVVVHS